MVQVSVEPRLIFVRGVYTMKQIEKHILEATGKKRVVWKEWTFVGLADEDSKGLSTALPYTPPDDGRESVGFKIPKKK